MNISELCEMLQFTSNVTITPLLDNQCFEDFCNKWRFHKGQDYLFPDTLEWLLNSLKKDRILLYLDCFRIRFAFLWLENVPVAIGPYCTEILTEVDYAKLSRQSGIMDVPSIEVLTYRRVFPVIDEKTVLHLSQCLTRYALDERSSRETMQISATAFYDKKDDAQRSYKPFSVLVQERYTAEQEFIEYIKHGDRAGALKKWKDLHNSVELLKKSVGYTIENARISAAITRTMIRIAGVQAGLPAELSDWITSQSAGIIRKAKTIEEINAEHERLIREYCNAIHSFRTEEYSLLVLSVIYHLEHMYSEEIIMSHLAEELNVTVNYMITQFHKETGMTPVQYLRNERLRHAALLLGSSTLPIQEISYRVGFADPNYFAKIFRKEFKITPSEYRKRGEPANTQKKTG